MKKKNVGTTALSSLLAIALAGLFTLAGTGFAATMATVDPLPSLDGDVAKPTAVAVDGAGRVYVAESLNNRVLILSQSGALLAKLTGPSKPISVAVDTAGRIYVGSALLGNVTVFDNNRNELFKLGGGDQEFGEPTDIDIDVDGLVYVTDKTNDTIRVYDGSGGFLRSIGSPGNGNGQLHQPISLAIDANALDASGQPAPELIVLDQQQLWDSYARTMIDGVRIQFFAMDGTFLRVQTKAIFGYDYNAGQLVKAQQVTVDNASRIYVTDTRLNRILVYNNTDTYLGFIDNEAAPLRTPMGLSLSATGRLYAASLQGGRVNVFGIDNYTAMDILPTALNFTATVNGYLPPPQEATISNSGKTEVAWSVQSDTPWLNLPATEGTLEAAMSGAVTVGAQQDGLEPGTYQGSITVSAPGMQEEVAVTLTVKDNPLLVDMASLSFTAIEGATPDVQLLNTITAEGDPLSWTASADQPWLTLSKTTGSAPDSVKVYASTASLTPDAYTATITFTNQTNGGTIPVEVALTIEPNTPVVAEVPALPQPGQAGVKAGGKNWRVTQPVGLAGTALNGVWGAGPNEVLAVGDAGAIVGFDGKDWTEVPSATTASLLSIWGSGDGNAFAVGDDGTVLHSENKVWSPVASGTTESLLDVWGAETSDILAVGFTGTIYDDTFSKTHDSGRLLRSIWAASPTAVFAVGESGAILSSDGGSWTPAPSVTTHWLNAIWGSSATDVFAVGENGSIVHFDGETYRKMDSGVNVALRGVFGNSPNDVYAVGDDGTVLHYDGTAWRIILAGGINLLDIWTSPQLIVAVGENGTILTGQAGAFPWYIINQNIALVGERQKAQQDKEAMKTTEKDQALPALNTPETR